METAVNTAMKYLDFGTPLAPAWWRGSSSGKGACMEADVGVLSLMVTPTEGARAGTITSHLYVVVYYVFFLTPAEAQPSEA